MQLKRNIITIIVFILLMPSLCGGAADGFENALIELEERATSNVLRAVTTGDVEPLRAATWVFGQFRTKYDKNGEIKDAETVSRLNKLRLVFSQAAFSMRNRQFDAEKEKEKIRDTATSFQDRTKRQTVFNREAALELIHKGFVMEARHYGGLSEGASEDKVKAFKQLVDETVRDEELKEELLALSVKQNLLETPAHVEPFSSIRFDGTNVVFKIWSRPTRYILRTTYRDKWLSSPGEEISVPLGSDFSVIIKSTVLTFKSLPENLSRVGFHMQKVVSPRSVNDHAYPELEAVLLLKRHLKNPADHSDTPALTGLIFTNVPVHAVHQLLK